MSRVRFSGATVLRYGTITNALSRVCCVLYAHVQMRLASPPTFSNTAITDATLTPLIQLQDTLVADFLVY